MISRSSWALSPKRTSTWAPGMRSRIAFASGDRSSLMRMRMAALSPGLGPGMGRTLGHRRLRRRESLAELHLGAQILEPALHRADHDQHVEIVEVAQVGAAEDLSLRRVLA